MHSIRDLCVKVNSQIQFFEKKQHSISSRPRTHQRQCTKAADGAHRRRRKPASASPFHSNGAPPNDCGRQSPAPRRNAIAAAQTAPADARHRKQEPRSRETRHESRRSKRNFRRVHHSDTSRERKIAPCPRAGKQKRRKPLKNQAFRRVHHSTGFILSQNRKEINRFLKI